jgi:ligand-binding sensor domain-containing protein
MKTRLKTAVWKSVVGYLLLVLSASVHAQQLHFAHIGSSEGLPQRTVTCILQDSRGFLWIGTQEGLCRYDGRNFVVYREHTAGASGLSDDYAWCLLEDSRGMIWVGTRHGLNRFDPVREVWINYYHRNEDPSSLSNDWVTDMHEDEQGVLWIATMNGLNRMKSEGSFGRVAYRDTRRGEADSVWCLSATDDGTLWIGSSGSGLYALRNSETTALSYRNRSDEPASLPSNDVRALETDAAGRLWVGTRSGAAVYREDTGTFDRLHAAGQAPIVTAFCRDEGKGMWMGGYGDGLTLWSADATVAGRFRHADDFPASLSDDLVTTLLRDASGNIWIGTFNGGLNHANPRNLQFHYLRDIGGAPARAEDRMVWAVTRDDNGSLWIATDNGIHVRNRSGSTWQHIGNSTGDAAAISNRRVWCLLADRRGRVWAGTRSGLNCYTNEGGAIRRLPIPGDPLRNLRVYTVFESANGTIWIGTDEGLLALDSQSGAMLSFLHKVKNAYPVEHASGEQAVKPWCISEGKDGSIWVGTESNGLIRLNPSDGSYVRYEKRPGGLSSNSITCIVEGDDDALWMGTMGGGVNRLDLRERTSLDEYEPGTFRL